VPLCKNPYINKDGVPCPCGKCMPCRINRKRLWAHRIELESFAHEHSSFVTLTYEDKNLEFVPSADGTGFVSTLNPKHTQDFLKRLRKAVYPHKLRFYLVGEYGDRSWRPHYHLALFGYEPCHHGQTRKNKHAQGLSCCPPCDLLLEKWGHGGIDNGSIETASAGYIASYCTKKLTSKDDERLNGRHPEFPRQSNGIGKLALPKIVDALKSEFGHSMLTEHGDVPISLNYGGKQKPLGRFLRQKLREMAGLEVIITEDGEIIEPKQKAKEAYEEELRVMRCIDEGIDPNQTRKTGHKALPQAPLKQYLDARDRQKIKNLESRSNLTAKEKKL
jgi:hypothetical protein